MPENKTPAVLASRASGRGPGAAALPALRAELLHQRQFRTEQLHELAAHAAAALAAADEARLQVTSALTVAAQSTLDDIHTALQRLEKGSYGTCEHCNQPIPAERLHALPMSRLCTPCQYLAESARQPGPRRSAWDGHPFLA